MQSIESARLGIVGLGYVGLPLAVEFGKRYDTVGFDISAERVHALSAGVDATLEATPEEIRSASRLVLTTDPEVMRTCNTFVVTVPTPVDDALRPDLSPLINASTAIGGLLKPGDIVIYESTVYPGTTEEVCVPILESVSGLIFNQDFFCGYSPERINPGDRERRLTNIPKVTSGSTREAAQFVDDLYQTILTVPTHKAPSIRVAEASKVIENTQRDVNIALINELAMIFDAMSLDTMDVLEAAGSKWNFLPFRPGLVGGHCIGVDPYYLTHKATVLGYHPELILAARRINSRMGLHVAHQVMRLMAAKRIHVVDSAILVMGLTFKEDCPDLRNTRVIDVVRELQAANALVDVWDPHADPVQAREHLGVSVVSNPAIGAYDAIVVAVPHAIFKALGPQGVKAYGKEKSVLFDVKSMLPAAAVDGRL